MRTLKKLLFFYIYLNRKFQVIKEKSKHSSSALQKGISSKIHVFLQKTGIAAVTTILIYATMMLMNMGRLVWPNQFMLVEIISAFFFLLILFWSHRKISNFINSGSIRKWRPWIKASVEVIIVISTTLVLHLLVNFLPLKLIYSSAVFDAASVRTSVVMSNITSLFFYFLVERERSKRKLQENILRSTQLQKENFEAQIQSLKNQVSPHFLFNSLNVLSSLIRQNEEKAREFLHRLSKVYRSFIKHSHEQLVTLRKEMELTEAYIYLLRTRFGDSVQFTINISEDDYDFLLPPGSLQMLVENAIKHNGSTRKNPLTVEITSEDHKIIVKNNLQPRLEKIESTKTGLKNITRRYRYLTNKKVNFETTEKEFIAELPLLKTEAYESRYY